MPTLAILKAAWLSLERQAAQLRSEAARIGGPAATVKTAEATRAERLAEAVYAHYSSLWTSEQQKGA